MTRPGLAVRLRAFRGPRPRIAAKTTSASHVHIELTVKALFTDGKLRTRATSEHAALAHCIRVFSSPPTSLARDGRGRPDLLLSQPARPHRRPTPFAAPLMSTAPRTARSLINEHGARHRVRVNPTLEHRGRSSSSPVTPTAFDDSRNIAHGVVISHMDGAHPQAPAAAAERGPPTDGTRQGNDGRWSV